MSRGHLFEAVEPGRQRIARLMHVLICSHLMNSSSLKLLLLLAYLFFFLLFVEFSRLFVIPLFDVITNADLKWNLMR